MMPNCPYSEKSLVVSGSRTPVVRVGTYFRKSDRLLIQRYRCKDCRKTFSEASASDCFGQKKRQMNPLVVKLLLGGFSQRRTAFVLNLTRQTIARKIMHMGKKAEFILPQLNRLQPKAKIVEFDDLETFEHSKCKPLSVSLMVEHHSRWIMGFRVSQMPAKGHLAQISVQKYGPRKDHRKTSRNALFQELKDFIEPNALIKSDQNPHYPSDVKRHFPKADHQAFKGRRGCVVGQGELKRGGFDPLFSLNHTCAMMRDNIKRLARRTWCTTKLPKCLSYQIALYALYHNLVLLKAK